MTAPAPDGAPSPRHVIEPDALMDVLWDLHQSGVIPRVLEKHRPKDTALGTICECGEIFQHPSAKAWHRHASAMVLNALAIEPAVATFATWVQELLGMNAALARPVAAPNLEDVGVTMGAAGRRIMRSVAPPRAPSEALVRTLVAALEPLLDNAEGYDSSNVRAAFLRSLPAATLELAARRDELLASEERARIAWKELRAYLAGAAPAPPEPLCRCGSTYDLETGVCNRTGILANGCDAAPLAPAPPAEGPDTATLTKKLRAVIQEHSPEHFSVAMRPEAFVQWLVANISQ